MRTMTWSPRLVLPLLAALGCAHGPTAPGSGYMEPPGRPAPEPESESESDPTAERSVQKVLADQVAAWNRGDLEGYMAGYWQSPQLTFYAGGTVTTGWDETLARYRRRYQGEGKAMGTLEFANLQVEVLGSRAALARGRWILRFAPKAPPPGPPPGSTDSKATGLFTVVLRRLPEGWRVVHDHSCSD